MSANIDVNKGFISVRIYKVVTRYFHHATCDRENGQLV